MSLQTRLSALITAIKGDFDGLDARLTTLEGAGGGDTKPLFPIWAEENAALSSNGYEWSFGNGATGDDIGIPLPIACQIEHICINADAAGTSMSVRIRRDLVQVYETPQLTNNGVDNLAAPVVFAAGELLTFQTGTLTGSWSDTRICAWFREI